MGRYLIRRSRILFVDLAFQSYYLYDAPAGERRIPKPNKKRTLEIVHHWYLLHPKSKLTHHIGKTSQTDDGQIRRGPAPDTGFTRQQWSYWMAWFYLVSDNGPFWSSYCSQKKVLLTLCWSDTVASAESWTVKSSNHIYVFFYLVLYHVTQDPELQRLLAGFRSHKRPTVQAAARGGCQEKEVPNWISHLFKKVRP